MAAVSEQQTVVRHTPGPWTGFLDERDGQAAWLIGPASARPIVAAVEADPDGGLVGPTVEANARVIAAAPELLTAIKGFMDAIDDSVDELSIEAFNAYGQCVAAIAKAEGRS